MLRFAQQVLENWAKAKKAGPVSSKTTRVMSTEQRLLPAASQTPTAHLENEIIFMM